jgi:hypothetical protein
MANYKMPNSDGPLDDADLNSFVSTHTDFVVNNPQAQKLLARLSFQSKPKI